MNIVYDEKTDGVMIFFSEEKPVKSIRIDEDSILYLAASGKHVYLQIQKASKHMDKVREIQFRVIPKDAPPAGYIVVDRNED